SPQHGACTPDASPAHPPHPENGKGPTWSGTGAPAPHPAHTAPPPAATRAPHPPHGHAPPRPATWCAPSTPRRRYGAADTRGSWPTGAPDNSNPSNLSWPPRQRPTGACPQVSAAPATSPPQPTADQEPAVAACTTPNGSRVAEFEFSAVTGLLVAYATRMVTRSATESCCIRLRTTLPSPSLMTPWSNIL